MSACTILKATILNHITNRTAWTAPTTFFIALHTADPGVGGTDDEVIISGYTRKSVAANAANWTAPSGGLIENINNLAWDAATADWGDITHFSIHTASTGSAGFVRQPLVATINILSGGVFQFAPGKLRFSVL